MCAQSCPTLSDPMDYSLPGCSVHETSQARILKWIAISFSRGSFRPGIKATSFLPLSHQGSPKGRCRELAAITVHKRIHSEIPKLDPSLVLHLHCLHPGLASLVTQIVKNPPATRKTWVQSLGWKVPLEEGVATHSSIFAWRILRDRGAWWATFHGVTKSQTQPSD